MKIETHKFKIVGLCPLLVHNPANSLKRGDGGPKTKQIPTPEQEAKDGLYVDGDGTFYIPAIGFRLGLIYAVRGMKVGKRSAASVIAAAVFTYSHPRCTILDAKTWKPKKNYEIDIRTAVVGDARILRARPMFENWGLELIYEIDVDMIGPKLVAEHQNNAGTLSGAGDYRPSTNGELGRYKAELF